MVARRFGVPVPEHRFERRARTARSASELLALLEAAAEHFTRNLWTAPGTRAREYLLGPRLQEGDARAIRAGAAPDSWDDLLDALASSSLPARLLMTAGLVRRGPGKASGHYDRFRNRAVFPILNDAGKVVALRRAQPGRQRAQVPELAREPGLPEEPDALRPLLGEGRDPQGGRASY